MSPACAELMAAFDDAVVQPLVHHLEEIAASTQLDTAAGAIAA